MCIFKDSNGKELKISTFTHTFKPLFRSEVKIPCIRVETWDGWATFSVSDLDVSNINIVATSSNVGDVFLTHVKSVAQDTYFGDITRGIPADRWVLTFMGMKDNQVQAVFTEERFIEFLNICKKLQPAEIL
ncbi:hypothetical protein [Rothia nasimurium]|uniref:hypothetical protein n=1 Tax=Rothia nasimurium TaxID=85336 RepID=UPI001F4619FE|nr:hypothetical protein [Rothia nasimurium]